MNIQNQHTEMVLNLKKPGQDILDSWDAPKASAAHMLIGLADEVFELMQAIVGYTKSGTDDLAERENLVEESGDLIFYIKGIVQDLQLVPILLNAKGNYNEDITLADSMLKVITSVKRHLIYGQDLDASTLEEGLQELADYVVHGVCATVSVTIDEMLEYNLKKLTKGRYKEGYSDEAATVRADKE